MDVSLTESFSFLGWIYDDIFAMSETLKDRTFDWGDVEKSVTPVSAKPVNNTHVG